MDWKDREWLLRVRRLLSCPIKNGPLECKLVQPLWKTLWAVLLKLKIELSYGPAISLLCICPEKTKTLILKDCRQMLYHLSHQGSPYSKRYIYPVFIAALFTIAKTWKQPKCSSTDDQFKEMSHTHTHTHTQTHTLEYYSATKPMIYCHLKQYGWT